MMQRSGDQGGTAGGLYADLPVATAQGWCGAARLQPGDQVWCPDGPPQRIRTVSREPGPQGRAVLVPQRALGNPDPVMLPPGQTVALDLEQAAEVYGDPVVLVPAWALVGWRGIVWCRVGVQDVVHLRFARRMVIYAGPGLLLGCEGAGPPALHAQGPPAPPLTAAQATRLMACVTAQEAGAGLRRQAALAAVKRP